MDFFEQKLLKIFLSVASVILGFLVGDLIKKVAISLGANLLTIKEVLGCYVAGVTIVGFGSVMLYWWIDEIVKDSRRR